MVHAVGRCGAHSHAVLRTEPRSVERSVISHAAAASHAAWVACASATSACSPGLAPEAKRDPIVNFLVSQLLPLALISAPPTSPPPAERIAAADHNRNDGSEDQRTRVSLPDVFELLKRKSPRYKAYQADIDVAKSEIAAARVLPNPMLNLAILYLNSGFNQNGVGTYYANATLPLLIAGQRRMRMKTA